MPSFLDELARTAAERMHEERKLHADAVYEVRAALAAQWEKTDKPAARALARRDDGGVYKMTFTTKHSFFTGEQILALLPEELAEDVNGKQIYCDQDTEDKSKYRIDFFFGHKRDRILDELEYDDPTPFTKKPRTEAEKGPKAEGAQPEPQGDAALEVEDADIAAIKASVGTRVARVAAMTKQSHIAIMTQAVEALGFLVGKEVNCTLDVAWQRALLSENCRDAALAYERAIIEVEAAE